MGAGQSRVSRRCRRRKGFYYRAARSSARRKKRRDTATRFVQIDVNSVGERGADGVALDPDFANNRYVYVYYTANSPTAPPSWTGTARTGTPGEQRPPLALLSVETGGPLFAL